MFSETLDGEYDGHYWDFLCSEVGVTFSLSKTPLQTAKRVCISFAVVLIDDASFMLRLS